MSAPLSASDMESLRAALLRVDKQTQAFLGPLLPLKAVQHVLLTFLRDRSRSFEEWVWDPSVRQLLNQLREQNPEAHNQSQDVDLWFQRAAQDQWTYQYNRSDDVPSDQFAQQADAAQNDGKVKFKKRDFYAASNAFKKSIECLEKYFEKEYYGETVEVHEWDEPMQERYVTLCCNIAVCGIKMKELSLIKEYAQKALAVNASARKALYAMAKLHLMEHLYEDAFIVIDKALRYHPDNQDLLKLRREVDQAREKESEEQAEVALAAKEKLAEEKLMQEEQAEKQKQWAEKRVTAQDFVPLPTLEQDAFTTARLHTYFHRIKHVLRVDINQLSNPDKGEPPLFECTVSDGTTGVVLAANVQASSKKIVKNEACKVATQRLWDMKTEAGELLEEDQEYLKTFEQAKREGKTIASAAESNPMVQQSDAGKQTPSGPLKLSVFERQMDVVMLLNQLHVQKRLHVQFDIEDVSPKDTTEFQCTVLINGEQMGCARAISKKKARAQASKQALDTALEKNLVFYWTPREGDEYDDDVEASK
uniref:peptidylprolyl isomerase n=1 Tax=Globisporangium ultimum (strain ATCC 200006 / CBS 805.95 / DAOM BR144) TaxID=431595 RepID=K3X6T4_GLOUD